MKAIHAAVKNTSSFWPHINIALKLVEFPLLHEGKIRRKASTMSIEIISLPLLITAS